MKKRNFFKPLFLFAFLGLCSTGCNDDDGHVPMPNPGAECRLISGIGYDTIEYNAEGYATKLIRTDGLTVVTYDDRNQAVKTEVYEYGEFIHSNTFIYTNGLLTFITIRKPSSGSANEPREFKYDSMKQLTEETVALDLYTYTYHSKGNLAKREYFSGDKLVSRETYENYDNHPTPYAGIKGLPGFYLGSYSKNNPGKLTRALDDNNDGIIQDYEIEVITYTYAYNSNGYPTKITAVNGEHTSTDTYTYACD